jgi:DNA-binding protein H-NS
MSRYASHQAALADVLPLIESLELPYLESLQQLLSEHITKRRCDMLAEARAKVALIARNIGMTPEQLMDGIPQRVFPGAGIPKYRDPETGKTWSGYGTVPMWIRGKDRTQFLIQDDAQ